MTAEPSRFEVSDSRTHTFVMAYHDHLQLCDSSYERSVYVALLEFVNYRSEECDPTHAALAARAGVGERKLRDVLKSLRSKGLIDWERQVEKREGTYRQKPNKYRMMPLAAPRAGRGGLAAPGAGSTAAPGAAVVLIDTDTTNIYSQPKTGRTKHDQENSSSCSVKATAQQLENGIREVRAIRENLK